VAEGSIGLPPDEAGGKKLRTLTGGAAQPADTHQEVDSLAHPDGTLVVVGSGLPVALDVNGQLTSLLTTLASQTTLAAVLAALATVAVTGPLTDAQLRAAKVGVADDFQGGECLPDQTGAGAVLTFTFSAPRNLIVVHAVGASQVARADPFGGTPSATQGFRCPDDAPTYLAVVATVVRVFAPAGMVVSVAGSSRA